MYHTWKHVQHYGVTNAASTSPAVGHRGRGSWPAWPPGRKNGAQGTRMHFIIWSCLHENGYIPGRPPSESKGDSSSPIHLGTGLIEHSSPPHNFALKTANEASVMAPQVLCVRPEAGGTGASQLSSYLICHICLHRSVVPVCT